MITAEELVIEIDNSEESKNFKLATVVELFTNKTAKIKFDGEDAPSEKQYAYLDSYVPKINDRILLGVLGGTYVILGKVNYNVSPSVEEEIDRYIFDLKTVSILKGLQVSGVFTVNEGMTIVGNVGVNGTITATSLSSSGNITASGTLSGGNISTSGTLGAGDTTLSKLTVSGATTLSSLTLSGTLNANNIVNVGNTLNANAGFLHKGSGLSFFNKNSLVSKITVGTLAGTPTVDTLQSKLNALITALQNYGLIN